MQEGTPDTFRPTDISGCVIWLDGNDASAVNANPFLEVLSWHNKGDLSGNFDISGSSAVRYDLATINGLNCLTFYENAYLVSSFALDFQDRSMFFVTRRKNPIDPSGNIFTWFTADNSDGQESGILDTSGVLQYILSKHPGWAVELDFEAPYDTTGTAELATFVNASDISANYVALNGQAQIPIVNNPASNYNTSTINYYVGNFFASNALPNDFDYAEMVMYNSALNLSSIQRVEDYLMRKWAISNINPSSISTFQPTDISGLAIWFDAANNMTIETDPSGQLISWSNLGYTGGAAVSSIGYANVQIGIGIKDNVYFSSGTELLWDVALPYLDRTQFVVFEATSDLSGAEYPYMNFIQSYTNSALQTGYDYVSSLSSFNYSMAQQGQNFPVYGSVGMDNPLNSPKLVIFQNNSTDISANALYVSPYSANLNTGSNLGNLFLSSLESYYLGNYGQGLIGQEMRLAELLEYDSVLSPSNLSSVITYLSDKWSL